MKEINYQFRQRYSIVHSKNRRDNEKRPSDNQIEVTSDWCITLPDNADVVLTNAARDLEDYLFTSMEISVRIERENRCRTERRIAYGIDESLPDNSYRFAVDKDRITLCGRDSRMAAQAGYYLEDIMNLCEAPFAEPCNTVRTSLYNPRMVHSGYGLDMFPTEHLLSIAHSGISALLVFVTDIDMTPHGYHDFNDLCYRASQYGLDVYAYSYLANRLHPEDEGAWDFYEKLYGGLFDRCPYFKGIIFVGESCEFPSKDPHTTGIRRLDNRGPDGKPLVTGKLNPGWWPCYDYPIWLEMVKQIIRKRRPDADIVLWSYNWNSAPAEARKALIDTLPKDITLQATFEMGDVVVRDGIENRPTDYTIFFPGPSYYFKTEAEYAKENGLRLYSMTNTGGRTWDVGVVPYIPAPYQWIKRYDGMRNAHDNFGLSGTMDCHHYGFVPSFISDLAKWAFHTPTPDLGDMVKKLVARDFSVETTDIVCRAYELFSEGIDHLISTNPDQYGPCRIGPSYPFVLFNDVDVKIPTTPYAHFGGNKICFPVYGKRVLGGITTDRGLLKTEESRRKFDYEIENLKICARLYDEGCGLIQSAIPMIPERKRETAERILGVGRFIANTARTACNVKEFYKCKSALLDTHGTERNQLVDKMLEICRLEEKNAKNTLPLVDFDSALGYEASMEYMCDRAHIEWKLELLDKVVNTELPSYYEKV